MGGTLFDDGAHIEMTDSPCKVCVCQDGTVECDTLTCNWRKDCTPKYEAGVCCPTFVNCPGGEGTHQLLNFSTLNISQVFTQRGTLQVDFKSG